MPPSLLISVRDAAEAVVACEHGADIVDIKDPARGALGRATNEVVSAIVEAIEFRSEAASIPVTMALGELRELDRDSIEIPHGISALKLGLAGCASRHDWQSDWADFKASCDAQLPLAPDWVAVVYADHRLAESPAAIEVIRTGAELNCRGVLIDTFTKSAGRLWDFVDAVMLRDWADAIHDQGMFAAVAGSLRACDLNKMSDLPVDIVAVRGGVCSGGERHSTIDARRIREFRQAMHVAWPNSQVRTPKFRRQSAEPVASLSLGQHRLADSIRGRE
jgi:uncharacterized protein (UPF0264 family)